MPTRPYQNQAHIKSIEHSTFVHAGTLDTGWHQHMEHQLIYAEGGVLYVLTAESQFLLPAYHGAWIPARCDHKLVSKSEDTRIWLLYFQPREELSEALLPNEVRIFSISRLAREMVTYTEHWSSYGVDERTRQHDDATKMHFYATIRLLAAEWCQDRLMLSLPIVEDGLLAKITEHIIGHLEERLAIESVGAQFGISGRTLMRLFRSQLGLTFGTYLRMARIVKAVELLTHSESTVLDVAYAVGYNSPSAFSQAFRKLTGTTPQAYANSNR